MTESKPFTTPSRPRRAASTFSSSVGPVLAALVQNDKSGIWSGRDPTPATLLLLVNPSLGARE